MQHDWQLIVDEHGPMVWGTIFRILGQEAEAQDCYQNVLMEAFENSKGKAIDNWPGMLRWMAVRRGIDQLRRLNRRRENADEDVSLALDQGSLPVSRLEESELKDRLRVELTKLPETQAVAFWLRFVEEFSYNEIAKQLDIPTSTVGVLLHRGRSKIRVAMADLCPTSK